MEGFSIEIIMGRWSDVRVKIGRQVFISTSTSDGDIRRVATVAHNSRGSFVMYCAECHIVYLFHQLTIV